MNLTELNQQVSKLHGVCTSSYKGNPLLCFEQDTDQYGFRAGKNKWRKFLNAVDANGADAVITLIRNFVEAEN